MQWKELANDMNVKGYHFQKIRAHTHCQSVCTLTFKYLGPNNFPKFDHHLTSVICKGFFVRLENMSLLLCIERPYQIIG